MMRYNTVILAAAVLTLLTGCGSKAPEPQKVAPQPKKPVVSTAAVKKIDIPEPKKVAPKPVRTTFTPSEDLAAMTEYYLGQMLKKPKLPDMPQKPTVPASQTLVKGEFETSDQFQKRLSQARSDRVAAIEALERKYADDVKAYNTKVQQLTEAYNQKLSAASAYHTKAMIKAFGALYGAPKLTNLRYDADSQQYFADLEGLRGFKEPVALKVPLAQARAFKEQAASLKPEVHFTFRDDKMLLTSVEIPFRRSSYTAMLTDADYQPLSVSQTVSAGRLDLAKAELLDSTFSAAKSDYDIGSVDYGIAKDVARLSQKDFTAMQKARMERFNEGVDDLPGLLEKHKAAPRNANAYAIVFGVEDYLLENNVPFSANSALMFAQYAQKLLGVPERNVWLLVGSDKTTSGFIKSQWQDFLSAIEPGAVVYFFYSGHGVPGSDGAPYLLPRDMSAEAAAQEPRYKLSTVYDELSKTKAGRIIAFVDSCFSGKDSEGKLLFDGVAPVLRTKKAGFDHQRMTVFSAGAATEFANDYKARRHRLFSYYVMKGLAEGKTDVGSLHRYVKQEVRAKARKKGAAYKQVPQVAGKIDGNIMGE